MFVPLRIKKTEIVALKARNGVLLLPRPKEASGVFYEAILASVTDQNGVIDGSNLKGLTFPANYERFISSQ